MEKAAIAPSGARLIGFGACNLANALPRQINPSGILAPPINVAVSRMILRGGSPSGAVPIWMFESGGGVMKSALRVGTSATRNATAMVIVGGDASAPRNVRTSWKARLSPVGLGDVIAGGGVGSLCVGRVRDIVVVIPSTTVGAGETGADVGGRVD